MAKTKPLKTEQSEAERLKHLVSVYKKDLADSKRRCDLLETLQHAWHKATDAVMIRAVLDCGKPDPETGGWVLELSRPDAELLKRYTVHALKSDNSYKLSVVPVKAEDDKAVTPTA